MKLAEFAARQLDLSIDHIMLLRHSNENVARLTALGGTVEEYTAIQPIDSRYDYRLANNPTTLGVVVIAEDTVHGIYRIEGIVAEGLTHSICSDAHRAFDHARGRPPRAARKYQLVRVPTAADGLTITGWERRTRTPVQRSNGGFFRDVEVSLPFEDATYPDEVPKTTVEGAKRQVTVNEFERSEKARRMCIAHYGCRCLVCGIDFEAIYGERGKDFIHVHHLIPIASVGCEYAVDPIKDLRPICPNCHAMVHRTDPSCTLDTLKDILMRRALSGGSRV